MVNAIMKLLAPFRDVLIAFAIGATVATAVCIRRGNAEMKALRDVSHQIAVQSAANKAHGDSLTSTLRRQVDSIRVSRRVVIRQVERDTAAATIANRSLATARTVRDTNVALRLENQGLRQAVGGLWAALQAADQIAGLEHARGDSLSKLLATTNFSLQELNARVQSSRPAPKALRIAWHVVAFAAVGYAGYQIGRHEHCQAADCQPVRSVR